MMLRVGSALAILAVAYAPSPSPKPTAGAAGSQRAWWLPPPAVAPGLAPFAMGSAPMAVPSAAFGGIYSAPPVATGAQAYNNYLAYYSRLAGTAGANAAYGAGIGRAYAGYPYYGYGSAYGYPSAPAAAVPGVPGGATNVYSMYPSSYYRFRQQNAGAAGGDAAAAGLPRFAQRGGEMAGAEVDADAEAAAQAQADAFATDAAMLAAAHGRRAAHWSVWAGAGGAGPEGGIDAAAAQLGADAAGGSAASSAAAAAAAAGHMMAPLPPGLLSPSGSGSAYSPGQRAARLAAMRAELDERMTALKALHEKRVAAAAAAQKAGGNTPAAAAEASKEAAADAAEEERLARDIEAAMAMPAELEGAGLAGMPMPMPPAMAAGMQGGKGAQGHQELAPAPAAAAPAPAASSRGYVRPRIVEHVAAQHGA